MCLHWLMNLSLDFFPPFFLCENVTYSTVKWARLVLWCDITGDGMVDNDCLLGKPLDTVGLGPVLLSSQFCVKPSSVKRGWNSTHISLAHLQPCEEPVTFIFPPLFLCFSLSSSNMLLFLSEIRTCFWGDSRVSQHHDMRKALHFASTALHKGNVFQLCRSLE